MHLGQVRSISTLAQAGPELHVSKLEPKLKPDEC